MLKGELGIETEQKYSQQKNMFWGNLKIRER